MREKETDMRLACVAAQMAVVCVLSAGAYGAGKDHVDKGGAFAVRVPDGFAAEREVVDGLGAVTTIGPDAEHAGKVYVIALPFGPGQRAGDAEVREALLQIGEKVIQEDATITASKASDVTFKTLPGRRKDVTFTDEDGVKYKGYLVAVVARKHAVLIAVTGPTKDEAGFKKAEGVLATLAIEANKPAAGGMFTAESLKKTAGQALAKGAGEKAEDVLAAGDPALTVGSVQCFVQAVEICFDIRFTDAEFLATRDRFVEYYAKADAEGKKILAKGGAHLLADLKAGTDAEREAKKKDGRQAMERSIRAGAKAGIGWAEAMQAAIDRRGETLGEAKGAKPKAAGDATIKTTLTAASLDASLEMLYFMWVAAGREESAVTPEAVGQVRAAIAANFAALPSDLQYTFANAEEIYPKLRQVWAAADPTQRAAIAKEFAAGLDGLGLTDPRTERATAGGGARQKSAWDDVNPDEARYGLVVNTAWNLAQKATR